MNACATVAPRMSNAEAELLRLHMAAAGSYFEYGCGGSTVLASAFANIKILVSVDSSLEWIAYVKSRVPLDRAQFIYVDINADSRMWGFPKDASKADAWPSYPKAILQSRQVFDLILVDGRFRVACCAAAAMRMSERSIALLHDCERYPRVALKKIDQVDSLGVYSRGSHSEKELLRIVNENRYKAQ